MISTQIIGKNILLTIGNCVLKLKEINFYNASIDMNDEGVKEFSEIIVPKIIKFKLSLYTFDFSKLMLMHMKNVEEVNFWWLESKEQSEYLFSQLKLYEKLKKLEWIAEENEHIDENHDFACVIQRLQYLRTNLALIKLFNFALENLTELEINYDTYDDQFPNNEINFANLTKLGIIDFRENMSFEFFYKWKMPKLEYVGVEYFNYKDNYFRYIRNIKIDNILDKLFNVDLFGKLIELTKSKSNVNVIIEIERTWINERFDEYKKKFEQTKLKNLQMKMTFFSWNDDVIQTN